MRAAWRRAVLVRPEVLRWYELRWVAQEIDDYATRILALQRRGALGLGHVVSRDFADEQARCLDELRDYLPVDVGSLGASECGAEALVAASEWLAEYSRAR